MESRDAEEHHGNSRLQGVTRSHRSLEARAKTPRRGWLLTLMQWEEPSLAFGQCRRDRDGDARQEAGPQPGRRRRSLSGATLGRRLESAQASLSPGRESGDDCAQVEQQKRGRPGDGEEARWGHTEKEGPTWRQGGRTVVRRSRTRVQELNSRCSRFSAVWPWEKC